MASSTPIWDQSLSHLSIILGVVPDLEKNCVGFARTKGRRCMLPASDIRGRAQASRILNEGTRLLESGEGNIDEVLEELAPLLLCRRQHQDQAGQLVSEWSREIEKFHERRRASAGFLLRSPSPAPRRDSERARRYRALADTAGRSSPASRTSNDAIARDNSSRSIRVSSAPPRFNDIDQVDTPSDTNSPTATATAATTYQPRSHTQRTPLLSTTLGSRTQVSAETGRTFSETLQTHHAQLGARPAEERNRLERELSGLYAYPSSGVRTSHTSHGSSRQSRNDEQRTGRSETSNHIPVPQTTFQTSRITNSESTHRQPTTASSRERDRSAQNTDRRQASLSEEVTRRQVEGECSICFLSLQDDVSELHAHPRREYEDLVWCRGRCGNNFHRSCMGSWTNTFQGSNRHPTCPVCRAEWVEQ